MKHITATAEWQIAETLGSVATFTTTADIIQYDVLNALCSTLKDLDPKFNSRKFWAAFHDAKFGSYKLTEKDL